ncbi:MAG: T9SS type A sorting domain-containing protein [candidate division WOR-3 bacterium]|nr:T9SS type A sorting domain-containing protein [candidate division WOR-3 bacterium]
MSEIFNLLKRAGRNCRAKVLVIITITVFLSPIFIFAQMEWICATDSAGWSKRSDFSSVVFNNKIWILGGRNARDSCKTDVWYSSNGIDWTCATDSAGWPGRYGHTSVVFDNKIWILGGFTNGYVLLNDVWYSSNGVNWTCATNSAGWLVRSYHTSVVFDNKIWIIGGLNFSGYRNDVWFSSDGVNWSQATASAQWSRRAYHTSVVFDIKMWLLGGHDGLPRNDVWCSSDGINWMQITASAGWPGRWATNISVVFNNKIWVMGGADFGGLRNDVWYTNDGASWICAIDSAEWSGRWGHASVTFIDKMWVLGGNDNIDKNDVWYSRGLGIEEVIARNTTGITLRVLPGLFNKNLKITYTLTKSKVVRISIYDSSGKEVKALFNGKQSAGFHELKWDGEDYTNRKLSAGTYFLNMEADGTILIMKMIKLK